MDDILKREILNYVNVMFVDTIFASNVNESLLLIRAKHRQANSARPHRPPVAADVSPDNYNKLPVPSSGQ